MRSKILSIVVLFAAISLLSVSCKKDSNGGSTSNGGFTYKENVGADMQMEVAEARTQYKTIFGTTSSGNPKIEINLTSLNVGDYTIGTSNQLSYLKGTGIWSASGGTVNITANANGKLSGTFISQGAGISGINALSGTFTDIEIK